MTKNLVKINNTDCTKVTIVKLKNLIKNNGSVTFFSIPNKLALNNMWQPPVERTFTTIEDLESFVSSSKYYMDSQLGNNLAYYLPVQE